LCGGIVETPDDNVSRFRPAVNTRLQLADDHRGHAYDRFLGPTTLFSIAQLQSLRNPEGGH
jgi:hypothetical protein